MEEQRYIQKQQEEQADFEARCKRCGACCGVEDGDPCSNLVQDGAHTYRCKSYHTRLGLQRTVSGKFFTCVPIRQVLSLDAAHPGCGYRSR